MTAGSGVDYWGDELRGGLGNDRLYCTRGLDVVEGADGNDVLTSGGGGVDPRDSLDGGTR